MVASLPHFGAGGNFVEYPSRSFLPTVPNRLWLIESGYVRSYIYTEEGSLIVMGIWGPGEVVGAALYSIHPVYLETITPVQARSTAWVTYANKQHLYAAYLKQAEALLVIRSQKRVELMVTKLLQWLGQRFGQSLEQGQVLELRLTHQDIAEILGVTRVTITRTFGLLEQQGFMQRLSTQRIILREADVWHYQI
ncbi:Crp/Fnr family transcriptional regulator [Synechococcus sp. PCC 6312]|uniref:Crp/Fnr family transcriptional regulator n=1 Tax=Synechococcus sp. (strain ATCC 27167 / PCC 6312) TaxID=195253 RepID=UPI00029ED13C|nr:Crp/Fnr family transcriptional regulator [Synechococcus sp. PCC 6312]AFY61729.1 cAMP-binding protein [Synechococcus sp. PCC 6312]